MPDSYLYGEKFQTKLLALFVRRPQQVEGIVEPHYFTNSIHAEIAQLVSEAQGRNPKLRRDDAHISRHSLYEIVRGALEKKGRTSADLIPIYHKTVKSLWEKPLLADEPVIKEQALAFAKDRKYREALVEGERDINAGHYDNAQRRFDRLRQFSPQSRIFHSYSDFKNAPELSFAIEEFLQNEAATMIGGLSGHGKTWIMLSMVKALLTGEPLWGHFKVPRKSHHVIYLIPESSLAPFKSRLLRMGLMRYVKNHRLRVHTLSAGPKPQLDDPRLLAVVKRAHLFLDTAIRFGEGELNSASDNDKGLASAIFTLLSSGARSVTGAHHSPKAFSNQNVMTLQNMLSGTGDIGAMVATAWGVKQIDRDKNIVHIENVKARDFESCPPFEIIGRPYIDKGIVRRGILET